MVKLLLVVFSLLVLLVTGDVAYRRRREIIVDEGTHISICKQAPIELGIVLDSSSSIKRKDFDTARQFLKDFLDYFDIGDGDDSVRVALITYGKGIYPEDGFNFTTYKTKSEVLTAVRKVEHRAGLYTDTGKAVKYMREVQMAPEIVRSWAQWVVIVLTDGNSQNWKLTKSESQLLRALGVSVFAIGVGSGVRDEELLNIAGDKSRVTKVESYDDLAKIQKKLANETCIQKEKPTTTAKPQTKSCGELNPTDVNFVFSPASLGPEGTAWTTSFIADTISEKDMILGFRYGVISGSCPDDEGFNLDTYSTAQEYRERLENYDINRLPELVERLTTDGFSEDRGGRPKASKVAVIVVSRDDREVEAIKQYVADLIGQGVKVVIADPFQKGVQVEGAVTLTGQASKLQSSFLANLLCPPNYE